MPVDTATNDPVYRVDAVSRHDRGELVLYRGAALELRQLRNTQGTPVLGRRYRIGKVGDTFRRHVRRFGQWRTDWRDFPVSGEVE